MSAFEVRPEELAEASRVLCAVADGLRDAVAGVAEVGLAGGGATLLGGLDEALERSTGSWRAAQRALAETVDGIGARLSGAAVVYDDADDAVARAAGG